MGVHEWLLQRERPYAPDAELAEWMDEYALSTEVAAGWADDHSLSRPVKTRAIAPTGTIGIIAETTTGIEPLFCAAYVRRHLVGNAWSSQYIIDPVAERLHAQGIRITDEAYVLADDIERRLDMQIWAQTFVDHGISSTLNLPSTITEPSAVSDFGDMLITKLPGLRGMTVYPDGARSGQPLEAVSMEEAHEAHAMIRGHEDACASGVCGV
jgi:ribonucleoside-diphosphate reductase alpha chain